MKKHFVVFVIAVSMLMACNGRKTSTSTTASGIPDIVFREYEHQFGKVSEGEKVSWQFTFDNKGTGDLVLTSVSTTCGCTVPRYDSKPIKPGESGTIEVVFDASGKNGKQSKTITVKSNASKPIILLKITAEVQ